MGRNLMDKLRTISSPHVKEVRGKGLPIGVELYRKAGGARHFCEALHKKRSLRSQPRACPESAEGSRG